MSDSRRDIPSSSTLQFPWESAASFPEAAQGFKCRIWYSISRTVSDDDTHCGGMTIARSALSPSSPAPAARRKSGFEA
jgi:hypothetical protein